MFCPTTMNMGNGGEGGRKICNIRILHSLLSGAIYFVKSQLILPITMQNLRNCRNCLHQILMTPGPYKGHAPCISQ